jgi:hypothetical protein
VLLDKIDECTIIEIFESIRL